MMSDSSEMRIIHFPPNRSIGTVYASKSNGTSDFADLPGYCTREKACGDIVVPANQLLTIKAAEDTTDDDMASLAQ